MRVYLFRHGEALLKDDPSVSSDPERPLVDEGIRRTRQGAEGLLKMQIPLDAVFTSPWLRARQTAEIVCEVLGLTAKLQVMPELAGDGTVEGVLNALVRQSTGNDLMLVGHNPLLAELAAHLLCLSTELNLDLKKGGVCAIDVKRIPPKSPGTLLWLLTARQLRAMR